MGIQNDASGKRQKWRGNCVDRGRCDTVIIGNARCVVKEWGEVPGVHLSSVNWAILDSHMCARTLQIVPLLGQVPGPAKFATATIKPQLF